MRVPDTNLARADASAAIALQALAWTLSDDARAERLLALTGLDAQGLRGRLGDPLLLDAALGFLATHQPDLIACAHDLGLSPARLIAARQDLNPESDA